MKRIANSTSFDNGFKNGHGVFKEGYESNITTYRNNETNRGSDLLQEGIQMKDNQFNVDIAAKTVDNYKSVSQDKIGVGTKGGGERNNDR